ncbi:hypothetical protein [Flavitalea sp.]|nr:hypothetical protein [Flavitalea sp.]
MGYIIKVFVAKHSQLETLSAQYPAAQVVSLSQELGLVPMTEALFDEINLCGLTEDLPGFVLMTVGAEMQILKLFPVGEIAYVEADYFGGNGSQSAVVWANGRRSEIYMDKHNAINFALKSLGISKKSHGDEFEALNLGRHRDTHDWR